jgi:methyl-accepting chemotaxis protein
MGTLVLASKMTELWDRLGVDHRQRVWDLRIIDKNGNPLFDRRPEPPDLSHDVKTDGVRRCLAGEDGLSEYEDGNGNRVLGAYRAITPYGLGLLLEMDSKEAFKTVGELRFLSALVSGLAALIVVLLGYILTVSMLRPIEALTQGAMAVSEGDLSFEIPVTTEDEIG